jgi:hypothetical protein
LAAEKETVKKVAIAAKARAERVRCISLVLQAVIPIITIISQR